MIQSISRCIMVSLALVTGCQERQAQESSQASVQPPSWQQDESGRWIVPLDSSQANPELLAAIEDGRAWAAQTRDAARIEWNQLLPIQQQKWSILWAAPTDTTEGLDSEMLWVIPISWTEHRVEATLASTPGNRTDLVLGDLIGFPVEELADWTDHSTTPPRGNEVLKAVERVIGKAPGKGT